MPKAFQADAGDSYLVTEALRGRPPRAVVFFAGVLREVVFFREAAFVVLLATVAPGLRPRRGAAAESRGAFMCLEHRSLVRPLP